MKKIILLTVIFALSFNASGKQPIRFGARAGINVATLHGTAVSNLDYTVDLNAGLFVEFFTNKWFSISPEILYSSNGAQVRDQDVSLNLTYIGVPVLANFYPVKGLGLKVGFQADYLVAKDFKSGATRINMDDVFKPFDLSIPVGISYTFNFGLTIDARYNFGVINILKDFQHGEPVTARNDYFSFTIGWKF